MAITEIFKNPTVKQVIFQVRYPNLFYIENKIGDIQMRIMKEFPVSSLLFRRNVMIADIGPGAKVEDLPIPTDDNFNKKIWQFKSEKKVILSIQSDSLDITSSYHKTYNLGEGEKFRDVVKFVIDNFLEETKLPMFSRIGLRYIDECPIPSKDNDTFSSYYNTAFPLVRFDLKDAEEMDFKAKVHRDGHFLRYVESLKKKDDGYKLLLDFDGSSNNVESKNYLEVSDKLHEIISKEFKKSIKEPVLKYMRGEQ